jgi:hypothetical protein
MFVPWHANLNLIIAKAVARYFKNPYSSKEHPRDPAASEFW